MSDALKNLAEALSTAKEGKFDLTKDNLTSAMKDASVSVPEGLDTALAKAFGKPDGTGLSITIPDGGVGPVGASGFEVKKVALTLYGQDLTDAATLSFNTADDGGTTYLTLKIVTAAKGWKWTWLGDQLSGKPFSMVPVQDVSVTFSADSAKATAVQAFDGTIAPPEAFKPVVAVIEGLGFPTVSLPLSGSMDFSDVDGKAVFLPVAEFDAPFPVVGTKEFKLGYFTVSGPSFAVSIGEAEKRQTSKDKKELADQQAVVFFFVVLSLKPSKGPKVAYRLMSTVDPFGNSDAFTFSLLPDPDSEAPFTPATAIQLVDNKGSFFSGTPDELQQFLGGISLRGLTVDGVAKPSVTLTSVGVDIGTVPGVIDKDNGFPLLSDPSNEKVKFAITDFSLDWHVDFDEETSFSYLISTDFVLLPDIFKGSEPDTDGLFSVQINSDYQIYAAFNGKASTTDLFQAVAGIDVGDVFEATISDVKVALDIPQKRYTFAAGLDVELNFGKADGDPIFSLTEGQVNLVAATPRDKAGKPSGKTAYGGSFSGQINVGPVYVATKIAYDNPAVTGGKGDPAWALSAKLAKPIDIRAVIDQYFDHGGGFDLPDFFEADLTIKQFGIDAKIPTGKDAKISYKINATFAWDLALGSLSIDSTKTDLLIAYDGSDYSGKISAITEFSFLQSDVEVFFAFQKDKDDNTKWDNTLAVTWEGLTATYATKADTLTFSLKNWSLGSLIEKLVQSLEGNPYFTLSSPWNLLNKIPLDGLSLTIALNPKPGEPKITAAYKLPSPIDLGFIKINGLDFARKPVDGKDKITLSLDATIPGPFRTIIDGPSTPPEDKAAWDKLLGKTKGSDGKPEGQSVDKLPTVPGKGNSYFNMPVLVLGQRVGIAGHERFENTKDIIKALSGPNTPSTEGATNPVSPKSGKQSPAGTPYYDHDNHWLIASHLQIMKAGNDWTVDLMLVFADPNLYGLRLALAGEKAKALGNLSIDIMYKKISDDVGVYQIEFTFPDAIRNLNFGQVSVVLPQLGVKIYTNGDFFIDVGFPYNMDFTRSFSVSTIVMAGPVPIPLTGAGGFYFGKLSSATSTQVPTTTLGTFDPVIVFGLGLQLGLGYNFDKGILKAGFALTVFGIVEGVIGAWHPYDGKASGTGTAVQDNYYFKVSGTVGIIGLLYGEVNFAIISASLNIKLTLSVTLTYESYQPIPIMVRATVDVSLKVKIDLGIFSFTISLAFHADVSTKFVVQTGGAKAPWDDGLSHTQLGGAGLIMQDVALGGGYEDAVVLPAPKAVMRSAAKPSLTVLASPQFTVMSDEGATDPKAAKGAFVSLLAMDAPDATQEHPTTGTSFETLLNDLLPWIVDAMQGQVDTHIDLADTAVTSVTEDELIKWIKTLSDLENPPVSFEQYLGFLSSFELDIIVPQTKEQGDKFQNGSALFPMFDGLRITMDKDGSPIADVDLKSYVMANETYRGKISRMFEKLTAKVGEPKSNPPALGGEDDTSDSISMAAYVFVDAFNLLARQLLQSGQNAMRDYRYPLSKGNALQQIIDNVNGIASNNVNVTDLVQANLTTPLAGSIPLHLPPLVRIVQSGDTLDAVAASFAPATGASVAQIILQNPRVMSLIPGKTVTLAGKTAVTEIGATFEKLAKALDMTLDALAGDADIGKLQDLLLPGAALMQGGLIYTTKASGDKLGPVADEFSIDAAMLFAPPEGAEIQPYQTDNLTQSPLFDAAESPTVPVPGLTALTVEDIWASITTSGQIAQIAGMLTRFLVYGMRLPSGTDVGGPDLSEGFLYPKTQSAYGLYQLLGQQIPVPAFAASDTLSMTLSRDDSVDGIALDFVTFNGVAATSGKPLNLSDAYERLSLLVNYAVSGAFQPEPGHELLSPTQRTPKDFSIRSNSAWAAADAARLRTLCGSTATGTADPVIWSLPDALTQAMGQRQQNLAKRFSSPDKATDKKLRQEMFRFLPVFTPMATATDPASGGSTHDPITGYCWATRADVKIRKLPPSSNPAGTAGLAGVTYEVIGASPEEALLLERCLSAMDALGKSMVSDLFLLYEDNSTGTTRLTTPASKDYVAFLTQTNLSTETNPADVMLGGAPEDTGPVRGIANAPADSVKLLWEQSTVRSGGYYLTWRDLLSGEGLPDSIFDDDGGAVLTLMISYDAAVLAGRMTNFINAFVTTDFTPQQGTQVSLTGQSSTSSNPPLQPTDSLAALSEVFGVGVGPIAEVNAGFTLAAGLDLPIEGAVHLVSRAEAFDNGTKRTAAQILDIVAAYYAKGTVNPATGKALTGADVGGINTETTVEKGAALFIPTLIYTTSAGDKLEGIAGYFGIELDRLAVSGETVAGLFGSGPIDIDSLTYDVQGGTGGGNIGFEITREAYPQPGDPTDPDYAENYMFSLYNVISAGLKGNAFFSANDAALPFGPQDHSGTDTETMRDPETRSAALAELADTDLLTYRQSLNIAADAGKNAGPPPIVPDQINPYIGVGSLAQLSLEWRDIFGNTTVTPWRVEPADYPYTKNGLPVPVLYADRLVPLGSWPSLKADYIYAKVADGGQLNIALSFATSAYEPTDNVAIVATGIPDWQQRARQDLQVYSQIWWQLNQNYKTLNLPWCKEAHAVKATLHNSLTGGADDPLVKDDWDALNGLLTGIIAYLKARRDGDSGTAPGPAPLTRTVAVDDVDASNLIPLSLSITFERPTLLVEPAVAGLVGGHRVTAPILPRADQGAGNGTSSYTEFAAGFESAFVKPDAWAMRLGGGLAKPDETVNGRSETLFALRMRDAAADSGDGIHYDVQPQPGFFAPKPLARSLVTGSYEVDTQFDPDNPDAPLTGQTTVNQTGVDPNAMFATFLQAVDSFLSPSFAVPAFLLQADGTDDPLTTGDLGDILTNKKTLAQDIAVTSTPVLSSTPSSSAVASTAAEKLHQAALNELAPAYGVSAVVGFAVDNVGGVPASQAGPANLYGQPTGANATTDKTMWSLSTTRFGLGSAAEADTAMAFLFNTRDKKAQSYVGLDLDMTITHLEHDRSFVPGIENYTQSSWVSLITGPIAQPLGGGNTVDIPVVLRSLPEPPTMQSQSAAPVNDEPVKAGDLAEWAFTFSYLNHRAAQDTAVVTVGFNRGTDRVLASNTADQDLAARLVEFNTIYPQIEKVFDETLANISVADATDHSSANYKLASVAVKAFSELVGRVTTAFDAWANPSLGGGAEVEEPLPQVICAFELVLSGDPKASDPAKSPAQSEILNLTLNGIDATYDPETGTVSATEPDNNGTAGRTFTVPLPRIDIPGYTAALAQKPYSDHAMAAWTYSVTGSEPEEPLDFETAMGLPDRGICFEPLNLFVYQDAWAAISVERNKYLVPAETDGKVSTNTEFLFSSPTVQFADPSIPELSYPAFSLSGLSPKTETTAGYLDTFFAEATEGGLGAPIEIAMEATYTYALTGASGLPRTVLPVSYLPPADGTADGSGAPQPVLNMAGFVDAWRNETKVTEGGDAEISFGLKVFSGSIGGNVTSKQPLLNVSALTLLASKAKLD